MDQEGDRVGYVIGGAGAVQRGAADEVGFPFAGIAGHGDGAGGDGVDADFGRQGFCEAFRQHDHAGFRGAVRNVAGPRQDAADIGGILPWPSYIPHCASKAGVIMLTKCLAKALAPEVRVNAIAPGTITMSGDPSEWEADFIRRAPLHRTGTTDDVADAVSFLIHSTFITGHILVLDGGRTL